MKQRIISAIFIVLITASSIIIGGAYFKLLCLFIMLWGSYEFVSSRNKKINIFELLLMALFVLAINYLHKYEISFILVLLTSLITLTIFDPKEEFSDAAITFFESLILGYGVYYLNGTFNQNKLLLAYIIIIAYLTDVFALFTGMLLGKHKLCERISPKKTVEGFIGGWIFGGLISFLFAYIFNYFDMPIVLMIILSTVLPLISQIGDLAFSLIKRYYEVKDFSKLIPGHGGLLDRLDSLLFTLIIYGAIIVSII